MPTAVLVTTRDRVVPVSRQLRLARAIPGATVHEVDADHAACVTVPEVFNQVAAPGLLVGHGHPARHGRQLTGQLTGRPVQLNPELLVYSSTT